MYNPEWLKANRADLGRAFSYFSLLVFVLTAAATVIIAVDLYPSLKEIQQKFSAEVPDFEAKFKDGGLMVQRLKQPYVYRVGEKDFTLVVDTISTTSVSLADYVTSTPNTSLIISADRIELNEVKNGLTRVQKWTGVEDADFTKADIESAISKFLTPLIFFVAVLFLFVGLYIGFYIAKLYSIFVAMLVVGVFAKVTGRELKLREIFVMGLYAITLPTIIAALFTLVGLDIAYVQFLALLAFLLAVLFTIPAKEIKEE